MGVLFRTVGYALKGSWQAEQGVLPGVSGAEVAFRKAAKVVGRNLEPKEWDAV